jgi:hypothetical protein
MAHPHPAQKHQPLLRSTVGRLGATAAARWSPIPSPPPAVQRREEAEAELVEAEVAARRFDTTERRVTLFWRSIFCCITVVLIGITVSCYLDGSHATIPFVTGPFGIATGLASYFGGPKSKADP